MQCTSKSWPISCSLFIGPMAPSRFALSLAPTTWNNPSSMWRAFFNIHVISLLSFWTVWLRLKMNCLVTGVKPVKLVCYNSFFFKLFDGRRINLWLKTIATMQERVLHMEVDFQGESWEFFFCCGEWFLFVFSFLVWVGRFFCLFGSGGVTFVLFFLLVRDQHLLLHLLPLGLL